MAPDRVKPILERSDLMSPIVSRSVSGSGTTRRAPPGPDGEDFRAAFGLADDDRTYFAVYAQGVALAAIQALDALVAAQRRWPRSGRRNRFRMGL
jgi:hypothetical protein